MENNVGARLREERTRLNLSQSAFADVAGVTKTTQGNYETNKRSPDALYLAAIAQHGVDIQYVVTGQRAAHSGVAVDTVKSAVEKAFTMVSAANMAVTPAQLAAMVVAFLPETQAGSVDDPTPSGGGHRVQGDGNMVASGSGITQVGGRVRIRTGKK
ncbi:helix-turn-helix transcriptional regulator [Burkholderia cenocepacia]|uniref:helix-turn-helix domain-containing protein n=1 Tax=Burkholderia cepacia complex TaxID=87882 RepID=UPI001F1DF283|nr:MULTISPECIES: helix-turn-helix transcriptional regulator [Burkholderia cepacia complex]MCO8364141.1 helix-turn-helix domain-containing protein [Burkholderia cenocepacia]MCO8375893.1 helix-turn-helix domain-containing protein [Burkholderia cenocepacia]MCO8389782.1 helix-turn-helix domain-containing protein [Burkholderia cenocepacia]MCO8400278.1 helix-turn-helix domain-containing protein [Burkholderia cenocepacia]MCO8414341.1 helix-turn-helix domain-containing protein [Burkholderia cenocepaci